MNIITTPAASAPPRRRLLLGRTGNCDIVNLSFEDGCPDTLARCSAIRIGRTADLPKGSGLRRSNEFLQ
jgi:hypothetical protein